MTLFSKHKLKDGRLTLCQRTALVGEVSELNATGTCHRQEGHEQAQNFGHRPWSSLKDIIMI